MKGALRDFYLGENTYIESWPQYKRAVLTSNLSLVCILASVFYIAYFAFLGITSNIFIYIFLTSSALVSFLLVRISKFSVAKIVLLAAVNIVALMSISVQKGDTGSSIFLICFILAAFTLFGYEERVKGYVFTLLSIAIFVASNFIEYDTLNTLKTNVQMTKVVNMVIASMVSVLMIRFLLKINTDSERILKENETSLKELNKELMDSRRRYELVIKGLDAGMWDWDATADRIYVSPALTAMLGYSLEEVYNIGKRAFFKIVHKDDRDAFNEALNKHHKTRAPFEVECRLRKRDGTFLEVMDTAQSEWDEQGNVIRMVGSVVDITDRKNVERKIKHQNTMLEKTNEELDRFVYITSHDLRAPLSSVLGLLKIAEISEDPKEQEKCLAMIGERITTLNGFIADIIDYSRNTRLEVSKGRIDFTELIDSIIEGLRFFEHSDKIHFQKDFQKDLVVHLDKGRLKIILNNLIANAIKYHSLDHKRPYVKIGARLADDMLTIEVKDNGIGIADEYLDKVFDMFYRASEQSEGSGLGLYITKEMVDKLGGNIVVESTKGEGTHFKLSIPV